MITARPSAPTGPEGGGTTPLAGFRTDIQGLRGLAVLVVVLYHAGLGLPGGFVAVDVFFVVSGFVITRMLLGQRQATGRVDLAAFTLRRIRRLLPAMATVVTIVLLLSPILGPWGSVQTTRRTGIASLALSANIYLARWSDGYFDLSADHNALVHLWTLSAEEQLYLGFLFLLAGAWWLAARRGHRARVVLAVLAATAALSFGLNLFLTFSSGMEDADQLAFFGSPTRAWEFAAGAALAIVARSPRGRWSDVCGLTGAALFAFAALTFDAATPFPGFAALIPVTAAILFLLAGADTTRTTHRVLSTAPTRRLGDLSYSWYLWHWPLIVFAGALFPRHPWAVAIAAAVSLAPAWLTYTTVENPIRRSSNSRTRTTLAIGAACVAIPLAAALCSRPIQQAVTPPLPGLAASEDVDRGCDASAPPVASRAACTWRAPGAARGEVVLLGDSNAGQFSPGLLASAEALGLDATIQTRTACPFADLVRNRQEDECRSFYDTQMRLLREEPPDVVVIANGPDVYIERSPFRLAAAPGAPWAGDPDAKAAVYADGLARTISSIRAMGATVVLIHPVPKFEAGPAWSPRACATALLHLAEERCGLSETLSTMLARRSRAIEAEQAAVRGRAGVHGVDLAVALCPDGVCRAHDAGGWRWSDGDHITSSASRALEPELTAALEAGWNGSR